MFQIEKKSNSIPGNKNQKDKKTTAISPDYYSIMQEQNKALNSQNTSVQLKEDEEKEPLQAKVAPIQRMVEEEEQIQMKADSKTRRNSVQYTETVTKMPDNVQAKMENSFSTSFQDINIYQNSNDASNIGAKAFTQTDTIKFAPGEYSPNTQSGQELLGHELTHVVQQRKGSVIPTRQGKGMAINDNPALEKEADISGNKAAKGQTVGNINTTTPESVQKKDGDMDIDSLAKAVYDAIKGMGTDEDAIHNVLNYEPSVIHSVIATYNEKYNTISGKGMVQDIINDTSGRTLELAMFQLKRANIPIPESNVDDNLNIRNFGISASKEDVEPKNKVTYTAPDGYKSYKWYVLNDPTTKGTAERDNSWYESTPPIYEGGSGIQWTDTWDFPGIHTVVCRVETTNGKIQYLEKEVHVGSAAEEIPHEHAGYELMAHYMAYSTVSTLAAEDKTKKLLDSWGYDINKSMDFPGSYGFFAMLIMPKEQSGAPPVIAFRGTEGGSDINDILTDLDRPGPGYYQYKWNKELVEAIFSLINEKAVVTGHSLGGALAQYATVDFASQVKSLVTFQSPGITYSGANEFSKMDKEDRPDVTHHLANNDIVDFAGEKHLEGDFYLHHIKDYINPISAHLSFLFSAPNFDEHREDLGIDDSFYKDQVGTDMIKVRFFVEKFKKYPSPVRKIIVESIRKEILH